MTMTATNSPAVVKPNHSIYRDDGAKHNDYIADPSRYTKEELDTMVSVCEQRFGHLFTDGAPLGDLRQAKAIIIFNRHITSDEYRAVIAAFPSVKAAVIVNMAIAGKSIDEIASSVDVKAAHVRSMMRLAVRLKVQGVKEEWSGSPTLNNLQARAAAAREVLKAKREERKQRKQKNANFLANLPPEIAETFADTFKGRRNLGVALKAQAEAKAVKAEVVETVKQLESVKKILKAEPSATTGTSYKITPRSDGNFDMTISNMTALKMADVVKLVG